MATGFRHIQWVRDLHLKGSRQSILLALATHCDRDGRTWITYGRLAAESGLSRRTAIYALCSLQADGYVRRHGRRQGRANIWEVTCAVQPTLLTVPVTARQVQPLHPLRALTGATDDTNRCNPCTQNFPRTTRPLTSLPNGNDVPQPEEVDAMVTETPGSLQACRQRFLASDNRREQIAALIDASGLLFPAPLNGGRAAGLVSRYGHGQNVIDALMAAAGHGAAGPADYMEKVLQGGRRRLEEVGRRPVDPGKAAERFVAERERMWG